MKIFPAIDIWKGKVVRLFQGDYQKPVFYEVNPLEQALKFEAAGFEHIHIVDLEAARTGVSTIVPVVKEICHKTHLKVDVGGGIRTKEDVLHWLENGVHQVNMGTALVKNPRLLDEIFKDIDTEKIIFSADVQNERIYIHGWTNASSYSIKDIITILKDKGLIYVSCTDITKDGTQSGINPEMYRDLVREFPTLKWMAGGGISQLKDLELLKSIGIYGCVVGKALYENESLLSAFSRWSVNQK